MPNGSSSTSRRGESFVSFFEGWLVRQEHYLDELLSAEQHCHESREEDLKELISRVLSHYEQYYEEKSRMAQRNIFLVFSPTWFSSFERSFFWVGGFKPSLAFRLLHTSINNLSDDQNQRVTVLQKHTKLNERLLNDELAKVQESVAFAPSVGAARQQGRLGEDGRVSDQSAIQTLESELEAVVVRADLLRTNTVVKVVEILDSVQTVKFFTAVAQLQLKIRNIGYQRQ